eukprot:8896370-Heterocapsa_arctica.AAC.1
MLAFCSGAVTRRALSLRGQSGAAAVTQGVRGAANRVSRRCRPAGWQQPGRRPGAVAPGRASAKKPK